MDYQGRVAKARRSLAAEGVDALLVTNLSNVRYLTGFSGTNGQVLVGEGGAKFFSDPRYRARAAEIVHDAEVVIYPAKLTEVLGEHFSGGRLGVESATMTLAERDKLAGALEGIEIVPTENLVEELRRSKEPGEVELLSRAVALGDAAFEWVLERLVPGTTERSIGLELEVYMRTSGADEVSFEPIVGSGPLSAHIHHTPSDREFSKGDLILLDFGCKVGGYCSDLTRTVVLGPATEEQGRIYETVLAAQARGIEAVAAGASGVEVDRAARSVVDAAGYGEWFAHGLGHGIGLEIHEAPKLHRISEDTLVAGDVVTVEPGVYLADEGGVRIEDCVLVTAEGAEVLTAAPKDRLLEL